MFIGKNYLHVVDFAKKKVEKVFFSAKKAETEQTLTAQVNFVFIKNYCVLCLHKVGWKVFARFIVILVSQFMSF